MDIRNVANHGKVGRGSDRTKQSEARTFVIPSVARDQANISSAGRETAAAIEGLAERARRDDTSRDELVAAATKKLANGEFSSAAVLEATARRLLDGKFLTV